MKTRKKRTVITSKQWRNSISATLMLATAFLSFTPASAAGRDPAPSAQNKESLKKDYALIFGTVWGPDNRPVYGVKVKVRRADEKKVRWERTSDHSGEFALRVPPGKAEYVITADVKLPKGKARPEVTARVENDERVDVSLHLTE